MKRLPQDSAAINPIAGRRTLFDALIDAREHHGGKGPIVEDQERRPLSYTDLIRACFALGRPLGRMTEPGEQVGAVTRPSGRPSAKQARIRSV